MLSLTPSLMAAHRLVLVTGFGVGSVILPPGMPRPARSPAAMLDDSSADDGTWLVSPAGNRDEPPPPAGCDVQGSSTLSHRRDTDAIPT